METDRLGRIISMMYRMLRHKLRGTGRTTRMIRDFRQTGDLVVFPTMDIARWVSSESISRRGFTLSYVVISPELPLEEIKYQLHRACELHRTQRIIFEHTWIEEYFHHAIENMQQDLIDLTGFAIPAPIMANPNDLVTIHEFNTSGA